MPPTKKNPPVPQKSPRKKASSKKRSTAERDAAREARRETGRRAAVAIRDAIAAALSQERESTTESSVEGGRAGSPFALAAGGIESALADAVRSHPSFLGRLAYGTAQLVSTLASEDQRASRRFAELAEGAHVGIVFVDVVGFTSYTASNGDDAAVVLIGKLERIVGNVCHLHEGEVVKHLGDGFLLAFGSASHAMSGAIALRDEARSTQSTDPSFQSVRIAVHAGRPSVVREDLIGHDVNLTARLLEHCDPGEVLVTKEAKTLAEEDSQAFRFSEAGRVEARGVPKPVATYRVDAG